MEQAKYRQQKASVGADGELSDAVFCTACGSLNEPDVEVCVSCHAMLTEQGNHASVLLRRISRRASSVDLYLAQRADIIGDNWIEETQSDPSARKISPLGAFLMTLFMGYSATYKKLYIEGQNTSSTNTNRLIVASFMLFGILLVVTLFGLKMFF